ncbi:MAG: DNA helicase RecQ [Robiginitomaculum sp.]
MLTPDFVLKQTFGFDAFRPGQGEIIDGILAGKNTLAVMPTGAGKSLCYQVPALIFDKPTVIISPLVALMDNQVAGLRLSGAPVAAIHSGYMREDNVASWRDFAAGRVKILYLSPERLMSPRMLAAMDKVAPAMFVIDEAHCVSKWGPAFRPEYDQLQDLKTRYPDAVISAFTATADEATRADIAQKLFASKGEIIVQGFDRPNLELSIAPKTHRKTQLLALMENVKGESGIVYCLSRKSTMEMAELLCDNGYTALPYHAGLDAKVRFDNQERFMAESAVVIVATIAFGMGIDKPDIRFVYHVNLPGSLEAYYQEIGRAGRDGAPAVTAMLYGMDDVRMRRRFIEDDGSDSDHQMREHKRLDSLLAYCEAAGCRRQILLTYFGEDAQPCGNCDNCQNPPKLVDASEPARILMTAIEQTGQRFGAGHVIDVARGAQTAKVTQFGHENLDSYGAGKAMGKPYLQALIRQAVGAGLLTIDIAGYGALHISSMGRAVMAGTANFECKDIVAELAKTKGKSSSGSRARKSALIAQLSDRDADLMGALKSLRMTLAREKSVPAYVIFSDAALMDMARKRPSSKAQMLGVSGVGEVKYQRYGEAFLAIIAGDG